jgi:hypothetical protein
MEVAANVRSQLPKGANIRHVVNTKLTTTGEQIVFYDTGSSPVDPRPAIAVVTSRHITVPLALDETDAQYLGSCEFELANDHKAIAVAYQFAGDGSGTEFVVLVWQSGAYRIVLDKQVSQGRIVLGVGELSLWDSVGSAKCVWCSTRYTVVRYVWRDGRYQEVSKTTTEPYNPEEISVSPLVFAHDVKPPRSGNTR